MALFSDAGIQFLFRWIHFLSGITWIGLLYYFNFVQGPFMAEADAATKSGATQKLVPRALWWFRWSAALTFLSGVVVLALRRASWSDPWGLTILSGAAFGINALVGPTGPTKKPIETVRGVIVTGFVTAILVYWIAQAVLSSQGA